MFRDILLDRVVYVVISCVSKLCAKLTAVDFLWLPGYTGMITILCKFFASFHSYMYHHDPFVVVVACDLILIP